MWELHRKSQTNLTLRGRLAQGILKGSRAAQVSEVPVTDHLAWFGTDSFSVGGWDPGQRLRGGTNCLPPGRSLFTFKKKPVNHPQHPPLGLAPATWAKKGSKDLTTA